MSRWRVALLALLALVSVGGTALLYGGDTSLASLTRAEARKRNIKEELTRITGHEWAGSYYYGDGVGENVRLLVAPETGFVFEWRGCLGLYDLNYGSVSTKNGTIRLEFEHPNYREALQGFPPELAPVSWGDRHYLIPTDQLLEFANEVNGGLEPRKARYGVFPLRDGDERRKVRGQPAVPASHRGYLLAKPIEAHIVAVQLASLESPRWCESPSRVTMVTLDAGSAQGVRTGMEFHVHTPEKTYAWAEVISVADTTSEVKFVQCEESPPPAAGWKLSTRMRRP